MLNVVCWKWEPAPGYRSKFTAEHVNTLASMVSRNLKIPHRVTCLTDRSEGIDSSITVLSLPASKAGQGLIPNSKPNCFRRLWAFSAEGAKALGPHFVSIDLDCVIVGDITPLVTRPEDFIIWKSTDPRARPAQYNGSMWMLRGHARPHVWNNFCARQSPLVVQSSGLIGSDQAWMSLQMPVEATWDHTQGVHSFRNEISKRPMHDLPSTAKIVFFHGKYDPWHPQVLSNYQWVRKFYR